MAEGQKTKSLTTFNDRVYSAVQKIPKGKVATYGQIAEKLKMLALSEFRVEKENLKFKIDARMVGWALHANRSSDVPCHRVVNREGRLAPNFAFDGAVEQKRRLEVEGVEFIDDMHVDLDKCLWQS